MKDSGQVRTLATQIGSVAQRMQAVEFTRTAQIAMVKEAPGRTEVWKNEELAKIPGLEEIKALWAQIGILKADIEAAAKDWDNLAGVLRLAAFPCGVTPEAAAIMALLRDEALALENDPVALQIALETAAYEKDWPRLYSLALGRLDEFGSPLSTWRGVLRGLRFDSCDLPGQEGVMEDLHSSHISFVNASEAWEKSTHGSTSMTTLCLQTNAAGKLAQARWERQARMMRTPAEALQRAEDERTAPGARYEHVGEVGMLYAIFDHVSGSTRFEDFKVGPSVLARLNALTHIPSPASLLPDQTPAGVDVVTIPEGS